MRRKQGPPAGAVAAAGGLAEKKSKKPKNEPFSPVDLDADFASELGAIPPACLGLFSIALTVYVLTMHPSVSGGDNGELLGCACELGMAHPPGYPTFTIVGYLFSQFLPVGTPAFRVAFMCAACNAGASCFILATVCRYLLLMRKLSGGEPSSTGGDGHWDGSVWAGVFAGGMYALSPLVWLYSLQAEVFAMNNLFCAALVYFAVRFNETRDVETAYAGAFLIGFGLTNQHTLLFFALPIVVWAVSIASAQLLQPKPAVILMVCGLVGLSPYLLLFPMATYSPLGSWGDTSTVAGFMKHLLRKEYGTLALYSGTDAQQAQLIPATLRYFKHLASDSLYGGMVLLAAGAYASLASASRFPTYSPALLLVATWVFYLVVFHSLSNLPIDKKKIYLGIHMRFWLQPHIISFTLMGIGIKPLLSAARMWRSLLVIPIVSLCLVAQVALNYRSLDQSNNAHISDLGRKHLEFLPENTIMISQGDMVTNAMRYWQRCEKYRTDVLLLDETMMTYKWMRDIQGPRMKRWKIRFPNELHSPHPFKGGYTMEEFLKVNGNRPEFPVYKAGAWLGDIAGVADSGVPSWHAVPVGIVQAVLPKGMAYPRDEWIKLYNVSNLFPSLPDHYDPKYDEYSWEWLDRRIVLEYRSKVGFHWANIAVDTRDKEHLLDAAANLEDILKYEEMAHGHEEYSYILADLHNAMGMLWVHLQHYVEKDEIKASNRKIAYHFGKYVQLTPKKDKKNGQEKNLVDFLDQHPDYGEFVIPEAEYEKQRKDEAPEKLAMEEKGRQYLFKRAAAAAKMADGGAAEDKAEKKKKKKEKKAKKQKVA